MPTGDTSAKWVNNPSIHMTKQNAGHEQLYVTAPELFDQQEVQPTIETYCLRALDMYASENQKRGFARKLSLELSELLYQTYPEDAPEVLKLQSQRYTALERADSFGRTAKMFVGFGFGIQTEVIPIDDLRKPNHSFVQATDPEQRRTLDRIYGEFYNRYAGTENIATRDAVRHGKIPVRLPSDSPINRYYDKLLAQQDARKDIEEESAHEWDLNSNPADLIRSKQLQIEALGVLGTRRGRLMYLQSFNDTQRNSPAKHPDLSMVSLPLRPEGQSRKKFTDGLRPDQLVMHAKLLYAEATEFELLYQARTNPKDIAFKSGSIDEIVDQTWKEVWSAYNGWEEDTNDARINFRATLRSELSTIRDEEKYKRRLRTARKHRLGQVSLH